MTANSLKDFEMTFVDLPRIPTPKTDTLPTILLGYSMDCSMLLLWETMQHALLEATIPSNYITTFQPDALLGWPFYRSGYNDTMPNH